MVKLGPTGSTWVARLAAERQKQQPLASTPSFGDRSHGEPVISERLLPFRDHLPGAWWPDWIRSNDARGPALQRARRVFEEVMARTLAVVTPDHRTPLVQVVLQSLRGFERLAGHPFLPPLLTLWARRVEGQLARRAQGRLLLSEAELEGLWPEAERWLGCWLDQVEGQEGVVTTLVLAHHLIEALARGEAPLTLARERVIAERVAEFLDAEAPGNGLDLEGAAGLAAAVDRAAAPGRRAEERLLVARGLHRGQFTQSQEDLEAQFAAEVELPPVARPIFESLQRTLRSMAQRGGLAGPLRVAEIYRRRSEALQYLQEQEERLPQLQANLQHLGRWLEALAPTPLAGPALHFAARLLLAGQGRPQDNLHLDLLIGRSPGEQAAGLIRALLRLSEVPPSPPLLDALGNLAGRRELGLLQFALCLGPEDLALGEEHNVDLVNGLATRPLWPSADHTNAALLAWLDRRRRFWGALREAGAQPLVASGVAERAASALSGEVAGDLAELARAITVAFPKVSLLDLWADDPEAPGLERALRRRSPGTLLELWPKLVSKLYAEQHHRQEPSLQRRALRLSWARANGALETEPPQAPAAPLLPSLGPAAEVERWVDGPGRPEPMSPKGRAELLRCAETIALLREHLGDPSAPPPPGAGPEVPALQAALHHVLRAVAAGAWPEARYQGPVAARLLASLTPDQQLLWRQSTALSIGGGGRPDREVLLGRARLMEALPRLLAVTPASPGPGSPELRVGLKGSVEHRRLLHSERSGHDRQVLLELSRRLGDRGPGAATFDPALKFTLGPARGALLRLGQGGLAEYTSVLERAAALELPGDEGPYAIEDDRLSELWCDLSPGPNHPSGFRRGVTVTRAADAHQRVVRVHQGGRRVALAGLMVLAARWPGGQGAVLWLGPVEAQAESTALHRTLVEALAINKAELLGVPLVSTSALLLKTANRMGHSGRQLKVTLSLEGGATGWVHLDGVVDGSSPGSRAALGERREVQVDLQMVLPSPIRGS